MTDIYTENVEEDFEYRGFRCLIKALPMGHRCGYVVLPAGHVMTADSDAADSICVHGGWTFTQRVNGDVVFGFDCMHDGDSPDPELLGNGDPFLRMMMHSMNESLGIAGGHIWTREDVHSELERVVDDIVELEKKDLS